MTFITEAAHAEAGSGNAAPNVYAFQTSSFASEFEENKLEILAMVNNEALRGV